MDECTICCEPLAGGERIIVLRCHETHRFHQACLLGWALTSKATCPLCRAPIQDELDLAVGVLEKLRVVALLLGRPLAWGAALALFPYDLFLNLRTVGWWFMLNHHVIWVVLNAVLPAELLALPALTQRAVGRIMPAELLPLGPLLIQSAALWLSNELLGAAGGTAHQPRSAVLRLVLQRACVGAVRLPLRYEPRLSGLERRLLQRLQSSGPLVAALVAGFACSLVLAYWHLPPLIDEFANTAIAWAKRELPLLGLE